MQLFFSHARSQQLRIIVSIATNEYPAEECAMDEESRENEVSALATELQLNGSAGVGGPNQTIGRKLSRSEAVDDLAHSAELTSKGLVEQLKHRYQQDVIYTFSGRLLVAVNPFKVVPIYGADELVSYQRASVRSNRPHVFSISDKAFSSLMATASDQTILISGHCGGGKTEANKHVLQHVLDSALIACRGDELFNRRREVRDTLLQGGVLLEAFGNARTDQNKNSSRFGRGTEVGVASGSGALMSANISQFLLGTERLTCSNKENFHVFSYMLAGVSRDLLSCMGIDKEEIDNHKFLCGRVTVDQGALRGYSRMRASFDAFGLSVQQLERLFSVVGAIIRLGDIKFQVKSNVASQPEAKQINGRTALKPFSLPSKVRQCWNKHCLSSIILAGLMATAVGQQRASATLKGANEEVTFWKTEDKKRAAGDLPAELTDSETVQMVSDLLQVSCESLKNVMLQFKNGSARSVSQSSYVRDVTARQLYGGIFAWLVTKINSKLASLCSSLSDGSPVNTIAVLDVCGFESLGVGQFEQLCNNIVNEALQQLFWQRLVIYEQEQYYREGIDWTEITFDDNKPIVDLLIQPEGMLSILDFHSNCTDEYAPTADKHLDELMDGLLKLSAGNHHCYAVQDNLYCFVVCHFTGEVTYDCRDLVRAVGEVMPPAVVELLSTSSCEIVREIGESCGKTSDRWSGQLPEGKSRSSRLTSGLSSLVQKIRQSTPHFICCINPNNSQEPGVFDDEYVLPQIQHYGVLEAALMTAHGYPFRLTFTEFINRFGVIAFNRFDVEPTRENCHVVMETVGLDCWQMGETQVLMKDWHEIELQDAVYDRHVKASKIQKAFHVYVQSRKTKQPKPPNTAVDEAAVSNNSTAAQKVAEETFPDTLPADDDDVTCPPPLPKRQRRSNQANGENPPALPPKSKMRSSGSLPSTTVKPEITGSFKARAFSTSALSTPETLDLPPRLPKRRKVSLAPNSVVPEAARPPPLPKRTTPPGSLAQFKLQLPRGLKHGIKETADTSTEPEYLTLLDDGPSESLAGEKVAMKDGAGDVQLSDGDALEVVSRSSSTGSDKKQHRLSLTSPTFHKATFNWDVEASASAEYLELIDEVPEKQQEETESQRSDDREQDMWDDDEEDGGYLAIRSGMKKMPPPIEKTERNWGQILQSSKGKSVKVGWDPVASSKARETMQDLEQQPWYHGKISRSEAEACLSASPQDQFLIRQSETLQGYSLSVSHHGLVKHYKVDVIPNSGHYMLLGTSQTFPSVSMLVSYYHRHTLSSDGELLTKPCKKPPAAVVSPALVPSHASVSQIQPAAVPMPPQQRGCRTLAERAAEAEAPQQAVLRNSSDALNGRKSLVQGMSSLDFKQSQQQVTLLGNQGTMSKIQEVKRLLDLEQKIADAAERTVDLPNFDKKSRKKRKKSLAKSQKRVGKLRAQLLELERKQNEAQMSAMW